MRSMADFDFDIANPIEIDDWNDMVVASRGCTIFHSSNWAEVLHESYGYRPVYAVSRDNGSIRALLPVMEVRSVITGLRGVALPFTDYCNPLCADEKVLRDSMNRLREFGQNSGWNFIDFRGDGYCDRELPCRALYYGHILTLAPSVDTLEANLRDSTRRNIRKAIRSGVTIEAATTREAMADYYRLHCGTRRMHGLPPQPFRFFRSIHEHLISRNMGRVFLASLDGRAIAGAVFFHFGNRAFYKFGASDRRFQEFRANNLLMWEAIRRYAEQGFQTLCLGRTDADAAGLRQFKNGWGAEERIIRYYRFDLRKERCICRVPEKNGRMNRLLSRLPIPMLRIIGTLCYRHAG